MGGLQGASQSDDSCLQCHGSWKWQAAESPPQITACRTFADTHSDTSTVLKISTNTVAT